MLNCQCGDVIMLGIDELFNAEVLVALSASAVVLAPSDNEERQRARESKRPLRPLWLPDPEDASSQEASVMRGQRQQVRQTVNK